jgi:(S)-3,5-dihydroxyphenylglycine transaminase
MFAYDGGRQPTMKALDQRGDVLYIGSFSKTLFPGLRLGYLVADQRVAGSGELLAQALARAKTLLSLKTSPMMETVLTRVLEETGGSLEPVVAPKRVRYREQRDAMLDALGRNFDDLRDVTSWNTPAGGFFLAVTLPCEFGADELRACAADYGVIVSPMRYFCLGARRARQIRLSFSYVDPGAIHVGVERLASFVRRHRAQGDLHDEPI